MACENAAPMKASGSNRTAPPVDPSERAQWSNELRAAGYHLLPATPVLYKYITDQFVLGM